MLKAIVIVVATSLVASAGTILALDVWLRGVISEASEVLDETMGILDRAVEEAEGNLEEHAEARLMRDLYRKMVVTDPPAAASALWTDQFPWLFGYTLVVVAAGCGLQNRRRSGTSGGHEDG